MLFELGGRLVSERGVEALGVVDLFDEERLFLIPRKWSLFGLPMPKALLPKGKSFETEENGQFCFDVEIRVPIAGLIVAYKGRLEPVLTARRL